MTAIGRLDQLVQFKSPTETKNAQHEIITTWSTAFEVYAAVVPVSGVERVTSDRQSALTEMDFIIRRRDDVSPEMKITHNDIDYFISYVPAYTRQPFMKIRARRID